MDTYDATSKKQVIRKIYDAAFPADKAWNTWFFDNVYRDEEALLLTDDGRGVSSLLLQAYAMSYCEQSVPLAYISGVATDASMRHRGYMGQLFKAALGLAYDRGDLFAAVIPATKHLFFLYDKYGFATVVYQDVERYTSLHTFAVTEGYTAVEPDYAAFAALETQRPITVLHTERDYLNILADLEMDGGKAVSVAAQDGHVAAMALGTVQEGMLKVKDLLGTDADARETALALLKSALGNPEVPVEVWNAPSGRKAMLRARGMMRIINVRSVLSVLAAAHPDVSQKIRVTDPIIDANNGVFRVHGGTCTVLEAGNDEKLTLDVNVDILTRILLGAERTGRIFGIPSAHPLLPLMLD